MKNPALRKEKRYQPAPVIPLTQDDSLLDWLEANNRIKYREEKETTILDLELTEDEEIADLIEGEDDDDDFDSSMDDMDDEDDLL